MRCFLLRDAAARIGDRERNHILGARQDRVRGAPATGDQVHLQLSPNHAR